MNLPSVPSKKTVCINNGLQASSTSFITTEEEDDDKVANDIFDKKQINKQTESRQNNKIEEKISLGKHSIRKQCK